MAASELCVRDGTVLETRCGGGSGLNRTKPGGGGLGMAQHDLPIGSQGHSHSPRPGQNTLGPLLFCLCENRAVVSPRRRCHCSQLCENSRAGHGDKVPWLTWVTMWFSYLAAYVAVQGLLDGHHQDVLWENGAWMQP